MIHISNLSKAYRTSHTTFHALKTVNLQIESNEIFGLFGKSGSGKSTLLKILNGLEKPTSGEVSVLGKSLSELSKSHLQLLRRNIGVIFQNFNLLYSLSVYKNIALPLEVLGFTKVEINEKVDALLNLVNLTDKKHSKPGLLSGGQQQRVAIARALATNPQILLCDEPTSALDQEASNSILSLLRKINKQFGTTIVIISHDETEVKPLCHRFARLSDGLLEEVSHVA